METSKTGYQVQSYDVPVKRYCQTLDLRDSPELIAEYRKRHSQAEAWPEILLPVSGKLASWKWKFISWEPDCL